MSLTIFETSMSDAVKTSRENIGARWQQKAIGNIPGARERIKHSDFFEPILTPEFTFRKSDKVFTMGSCFARYIDVVLRDNGVTTSGYSSVFEQYEPARNDSRPASFHAFNYLNRFNVFSIENELKWALDPAAKYPENAFFKIDDNTYVDPHSHMNMRFADLKETRERRQRLIEINKNIADCRVVVLTLGLVEVWKDNITGLYMNFTPTPAMMEKAEAGRYSFCVTGYEETVSSLNNICLLLEEYGHPDVQIVLTVSPVTLNATFRNQDVVISNFYSKSLLRAAVERISQNKNIHYFPSYEIVMYSEPTLTWNDDLRHPSGHIVRHITEYFLKCFYENYEKQQWHINEIEKAIEDSSFKKIFCFGAGGGFVKLYDHLGDKAKRR